MILIKLSSSFTEITRWHGFSPVNLQHISGHFFLEISKGVASEETPAQMLSWDCSAKSDFTLQYFQGN